MRHHKTLPYAALATLLAALSMLGPFSIDTYLPAFPVIQASLQAHELEVQQTLTAYMLAFAVMTLWHGALSDSFGRRKVILTGMIVFAIASFGCAGASSIHYLWGFRILQGISAGAGMVVGRAIIRDLYHGPEAERLLSLVTMIFSIAPAIAPVLGGWIISIWSWRAIFIFLFLFASLLAFASYRWLPETLPPAKRQAFSAGFLWSSYRRVFSSGRFYLKAGTVALNFGGLFLYISSAPVLLIQHLHLTSAQFAWQFFPTVGGIFFGALTANRLAGKWSIWKQVKLGFGFMILASMVNVVYHAVLPPALPWTVLPLLVYSFGMSLVAPGVTLLALDMFPEIRGVVASCQSATSTLISALIGGVMSPLLSHSVLYLALGQLVCCCVSACLWSAIRYMPKQKSGV